MIYSFLLWKFCVFFRKMFKIFYYIFLRPQVKQLSTTSQPTKTPSPPPPKPHSWLLTTPPMDLSPKTPRGYSATSSWETSPTNYAQITNSIMAIFNTSRRFLHRFLRRFLRHFLRRTAFRQVTKSRRSIPRFLLRILLRISHTRMHRMLTTLFLRIQLTSFPRIQVTFFHRISIALFPKIKIRLSPKIQVTSFIRIQVTSFPKIQVTSFTRIHENCQATICKAGSTLVYRMNFERWLVDFENSFFCCDAVIAKCRLSCVSCECTTQSRKG